MDVSDGSGVTRLTFAPGADLRSAWGTARACTPAAQAVGCWPFDEPSGTTARDVSGHGNHGTCVGGRSSAFSVRCRAAPPCPSTAGTTTSSCRTPPAWTSRTQSSGTRARPPGGTPTATAGGPLTGGAIRPARRGPRVRVLAEDFDGPVVRITRECTGAAGARLRYTTLG